jgi:DNA topoisomerase VI subunit B
MSSTSQLQRTTFQVSRELEFFTEKELELQIGHGREWWPVAVLKELVDNALDACEAADVLPMIEVKVEQDRFSVRDNGPGLPAETLARSLDYLKRVSDKLFYVSPTRGQLGNALKVVWAAPFVAQGDEGRVEVWTQGTRHEVTVRLDRLAQRPVIAHEVEEGGFVRNGTLVQVHWPDSACSLEAPDPGDSYNDAPPTAQDLVEGYAAFNPHATFRLGKLAFEATAQARSKWKPGHPTSAHWYTPETLRDLVAAYVAAEREGGRARTVRELVSEFRGLSSTAKQKQVIQGLSGVYLRDLVRDGDVDLEIVGRLLAAMKELSRPPKPAALGAVGREHLTEWMVRCANVNGESVRYVKRLGEETDGLPHVVEVALGVRGDEDGRRVVTGLNWAPTLGVPVETLSQLLGEMRVDRHDPVTVVMHLARPRFEFTDRGKSRLQL